MSSSDVFCRVIDNHGDLGVCWRLARQLAGCGHAVRLWCDDARALEWMAPEGHPGVQVLPWRDPTADDQPGDVVVEAFGCDPPPAFIARMARQRPVPVWINLEYLSAEEYVERSHGLASPQFSGPGAGLTKWFFYPGFTTRTGGLLREPGLAQPASAFDSAAFLAELGVGRQPGELLVSCFAYDARQLQNLLPLLARPDQPVHLLACPGPAQEQALALAGQQANVRASALTWLTQDAYDGLLHACDLNLVRGEDSVVRAMWAGQPFLWQIYPQADGAHAAKLEAFLTQHLQSQPPAPAHLITALHRAWNGLAAWPDSVPWPQWQAACAGWRAHLLAQDDLVTQLTGFVADKAG